MMENLISQDIKEKYKDEWLLFEVLPSQEQPLKKERRLVWHSKERKEIYEKVKEYKLTYFQVLYSGELVPEGYGVAL